MFYLPMGPGSPKFTDANFRNFGLGFMTPFWPGRWCYGSSCNFPPMQTRSWVLGGSKDRSEWAETHCQGRVHAFSSAKSICTILWVHVGEAVSAALIYGDRWDSLQAMALGMPSPLCMAQEARSFLCLPRPSEVRTQGQLRGSACSGLGAPLATPTF